MIPRSRYSSARGFLGSAFVRGVAWSADPRTPFSPAWDEPLSAAGVRSGHGDRRHRAAQTGSHHEALAGLELVILTRLILNSREICLCLLSAGTKDMRVCHR